MRNSHLNAATKGKVGQWKVAGRNNVIQDKCETLDPGVIKTGPWGTWPRVTMVPLPRALLTCCLSGE